MSRDKQIIDVELNSNQLLILAVIATYNQEGLSTKSLIQRVPIRENLVLEAKDILMKYQLIKLEESHYVLSDFGVEVLGSYTSALLDLHTRHMQVTETFKELLP